VTIHIQSQVEELATTNDTNIGMTKCFDANVHSPPQKMTNYIGVEPHNINTKYVITPHISMSTIPNSNNVDTQDQNFPTHEFHSLFQKMNNEQHLTFLDVIFREKKFQMNHFTCSLLEVQVHVKLSH
jgi:hypothetical protein